jgi:hypothetical protein
MKGNAKDYVSTAQQFFTAYDACDVDGMLGLCADGALGRYAPYGRGGSYYRQRFLCSTYQEESQQMSETHYFQPIDTRQLQKESSMKIALVGKTGNVGTRLTS